MDKVLSFSTVDSESLVLAGRSIKLNVINRHRLSDIMRREQILWNDGLIETVASIQYFCMTADMWLVITKKSVFRINNSLSSKNRFEMF